MVVGAITTYAVNAYHHFHCEFETCSDEVFLIQHYVIKFESDMWFSPGTPVSTTNKSYCYDITEILLNVALNTITITPITM